MENNNYERYKAMVRIPDADRRAKVREELRCSMSEVEYDRIQLQYEQEWEWGAEMAAFQFEEHPYR